MDDKAFYEQEKTCPICHMQFTILRIRNSQCIVQKRDTDFCVYYESIDPYLYSVWVCPYCGYASPDSIFSDLSPQEIEEISIAFKGKEIKVDFSGERNLDTAIASHKLATYCCELRNCKSSAMAGLYLKIAWLYRKTNNPREKDYLLKALEYYQLAYDQEPFPLGNLSELAVRYLIGELYRRTGNPKEAIQWFNRVVSDRYSKNEPRITNMARDQWHLAKEELSGNPELSNQEVKTEVAATKEEKATVTKSSIPKEEPKKRLKVSSMVSFYEDQIDWVKRVVANTNEKKINLNSEAVIRAVLDLVTTVDPSDINCTTEEELTGLLRRKLKE